MAKFSHISDIHIHNLKYHNEQKQVFEKVYEHLRVAKVEYNILTGDLFHVKSNVTPEAYQSAAEFLKNLADIAQTHVILGNHDLILSNKNRLDSVSPVIEAINHPNLFFHKHSEECLLIKENITLNIMSIVDEQSEWIPISDPSSINVALYHGSIAGVVTDQNWVMTHGEVDIEKFAGFDYVMLGDIHKANQCLDPEGRVRYAGSLCQNNFGEENDKGFLIWDIESKDKFTVQHVHIPNPKPFITIELEKDGSLPKNLICQKESRIRVVSNSNATSDKIKKAVEYLKKNYKPDSISYQNKAVTNTNKENIINFLQSGNLRNEETQKALIKEYLKEQTVPNEILGEIYELNAKYNREVEANEEVTRNIHWKLKRLKWDSLFNYGEGNEIDFTKINGTTGIFGKNFSGKSSIVDSLLFTIYNSTSKNIRKNLHVINQNKTNANCSVEIEVDGKIYFIERSLSKYTKKLKGEVTDEAKASVDFFYIIPETNEKISLNGVDGNETNKAIRKIFGTIEDFFVTSMSSQMGALGFINEGSTRRKEIIAKFLDLEVFESKFKLAKEESALVKAGLKRLENKDFAKELTEANALLLENESKTTEKKETIDSINKNIVDYSSEIKILEDKISKIDSDNIDPIELKNNIKEAFNSIEDLNSENSGNEIKIDEINNFLQKANDFLDKFNLEEIKNKKQILLSLKQQLNSLTSNISEHNKVLSIYKNHTEGLDKVPCGKTFEESCGFIKEAKEYLQKVDVVEMAISAAQKEITSTEEQIEELNEKKLDEYSEKYQKLQLKKNDEEKRLTSLQLAIEQNKNKLSALSERMSGFSDKLKFYEEHKDIIENKKALIADNEEKKNKVKSLKWLVEQHEQDLMKLYKEHGSVQQKIETIKNNELEKLSLEKRFSAYELFMRCMHSNGIAFDLIKRNLPLINQEVSKVLSSIVEFEIFFENSDNKLDIFIKHPKYDARPLENGSGAEKTIASMAIRIALLNVSNMPKPNIFILDEPGTALDNENMEGFTRILDLIKNYFDITILITHIDALKDSVDTNIEISRNNGYAYVKC